MNKSNIKTICCIHDFGSFTKSNEVECLRKAFPGVEVLSLDIPADPIEAFQTVSNFIIENKVDLIVASSLGAFYAQMVYGPVKILINPFYKPSEELSNGIMPGDIEKFKILERQRDIWFSGEFEHRLGTYIIKSSGDGVVQNKEAMLKDYLEENFIDFVGEHGLSKKTFIEQIKKIVDEKLGE